MQDFNALKLHDTIMKSLKDMRFTKPTPIQAETIPQALQGKDILGSAQTGTGKTAAYTIPLVSHLLNNMHSKALILAPTRELATQILETIHQLLGKNSPIKTCLLIGGDPIGKQFNQLDKYKPRIIVGTPGRVNDHLRRKSLKLDTTDFVVYDETDRMLDMGFSIQLQDIDKHLPENKQTLMFSATMDANIIKLAKGYLKDPVRIAIGSTTNPIENIKQESILTSEQDKYSTLVKQISLFDGSCVVFVKTKSNADKLANRLCTDNHIADAIHGDLRQRNRERVIKKFRELKSRILVATDIAARGLDIPHIACVINYDLPQAPEDYIHRIGRTGRAGNDGKAINLITNQDRLKWKNICKLMNTENTISPSDNYKHEDKKYNPKNNSMSFKKRSPNSFKSAQKSPYKKPRKAANF